MKDIGLKPRISQPVTFTQHEAANVARLSSPNGGYDPSLVPTPIRESTLSRISRGVRFAKGDDLHSAPENGASPFATYSSTPRSKTYAGQTTSLSREGSLGQKRDSLMLKEKENGSLNGEKSPLPRRPSQGPSPVPSNHTPQDQVGGSKDKSYNARRSMSSMGNQIHGGMMKSLGFASNPSFKSMNANPLVSSGSRFSQSSSNPNSANTTSSGTRFGSSNGSSVKTRLAQAKSMGSALSLLDEAQEEGEVAPSAVSESHGLYSELQWMGEPPRRFVTLSGALNVTEKEVAGLYILCCECQALGGGVLTVEQIKLYATQKKNGGQDHLYNLACSLAVSLRRSSKAPIRGSLQFRDLLAVTYPRALPHEIRFLVDTAPLVAQDSSLARGKTVPMKALSHKETRMVFEIYNLLCVGTESDTITAGRALSKIESLLPGDDTESGRVLLRQMLTVVPEGLTAMCPRDRFLTFVSINQASDIAFDLDTLRSALLGADVVLGRYLRKGEGKTDAEVKEELDAARPKSLFNRILKSLSSKKLLKV